MGDLYVNQMERMIHNAKVEQDIAREYHRDVIKLAKGNPGALKVLCDVWDNAQEHFFDIKDSGLTGSFIWVAYKDYAKENIMVMLKGIKDKDPELLRQLQFEGYSGDLETHKLTIPSNMKIKW